jgi:two-component system sensor kinase FixL
MAVAQPTSLRYFLIVESSPTASIMVGSDGVIQFVNAETEHMFGYRSEELIGQSIDILVPTRFREGHAALRACFFARPSKRAMGAGRDLTAMRRDGTEFPVEIGLTPIEAKTGAVVLATIIDISDRKKSEDALAQRAVELEAAVTGAVDGIIMIDGKGIIQWLNPAAAALFGYDAIDIVGQNVSVLMPEPYRSEHDSYLRRYLRTGSAKIIGTGREVEGRRKDGSIFPMDLGVSVVPVPGKRLFAGFVHDLSERRRLEARMEQLHADRLEAIEGMAAALAHEVNQPLSASAVYLKAARRLLQLPPDARPSRVEDALDSAAEQIVRAGRIISNLREFVARGEPNKTGQSLHMLIRDAHELMLGGARQANVRVILELNAQHDLVLADGVQIKQVLVNLMRNAIDAMSDCERRELIISTRSADGEIQTDVIDTGRGLPKETEGPLLEAITKAKPKGIAVGLSISCSIIESHYGRIWAEPNPGGGTIFRFTLPLAETEATQ